MKNFNYISAPINIAITIASLFLITSCGKEELKAPAGNPDRGDITMKQRGPVYVSYGSTENKNPHAALDRIEPPNYGFSVIKIEHLWQKYAPDYSVTIRFDGYVTFEGRRNCAYNHTITFWAPRENVNELQNLYLNTNFYTIADTLKAYTKTSMHATTCTPLGSEVNKTLIDFNKGYPYALISFRKKAESLMGITQYVGYEE